VDYFNYREGELYAENIAVKTIADAIGTPFYLYSSATLVRHYRVYRDALAGLNCCI